MLFRFAAAINRSPKVILCFFGRLTDTPVLPSQTQNQPTAKVPKRIFNHLALAASRHRYLLPNSELIDFMSQNKSPQMRIYDIFGSLSVAVISPQKLKGRFMPSICRVLLCAICLVLISFSSYQASAQDGAAIVRIPEPVNPHCINVNKDSVTIYLRRFITDNQKGWFTEDKQHGVLVNTSPIGTQGGANVNPAPKFSTLSKVTVEDYQKGQISVPLEFAVVSDLQLKQGTARYKGLNLDITLIRQKGKNVWGAALEAAAKDLSKVPIPANPYSQAATQSLAFINDAIDGSLSDNAAAVKAPENDKFAEIALGFGSADVNDISQCGPNNETTGTFAVLRASGVHGPGFITNVNDPTTFCLDADTRPEFRLITGTRDAAGKCPDAAHMVPLTNNYILFFINSEPATGTGNAQSVRSRKQESLDRCKEHNVSCVAPTLHY